MQNIATALIIGEADMLKTDVANHVVNCNFAPGVFIFGILGQDFARAFQPGNGFGDLRSHRNRLRNRSNQDPLNFPIKLNNRIGALRRSVETGDARPTNASYVVFKELSSELEVQLAKLKGLVTVDLGAFNKLLAAKNLDQIRAEAK